MLVLSTVIRINMKQKWEEKPRPQKNAEQKRRKKIDVLAKLDIIDNNGYF